MTRRTAFAALVLFTLLASAPAVHAQGTDRERAAAEVESLREQIRAKESLLLSVSAEDREAHAEFLAQKGTGLVRLLPREKWDHKLSVKGGGAYYSFARLSHEYGQGSDIVLEQNQLGVGFAGADFGLLVNLGNVPLETLTLETEGVRYLANFDAPAAEPEARAQHRRVGVGFEADGLTYKSRQPVFAKQTYALRSISYDRSDVLVAFRVVRKDSDGSVVLLWKMLKKFPKPELQREPVAAAQQ